VRVYRPGDVAVTGAGARAGVLAPSVELLKEDLSLG
jgi:hypothetical protein